MLEDYEEKPVKQFIILYYESLMEDAIKREDYEMANKYKTWIKNLKESGE
jgi:protein-arginine kinase activator protein McsA